MTLPIAQTVIDFPETGRHNPFQTLHVRNRFSVVFSRRVVATSWILCPQNRRHQMKEFVRSLWNNQEGQDIAEYAVMLAVILVIVVGTIRLVGANANNVFSSVASTVN
jgi:Flp pilus assembly pilin Flp